VYSMCTKEIHSGKVYGSKESMSTETVGNSCSYAFVPKIVTNFFPVSLVDMEDFT